MVYSLLSISHKLMVYLLLFGTVVWCSWCSTWHANGTSVDDVVKGSV